VTAVLAGSAAPSAPAAPVGSAGATPLRQSSEATRAGIPPQPAVRRVTPVPSSVTARAAGGNGARELIAYALSAVALALVAATALTLRRKPPFPPPTPRGLLDRHRNPDAARPAARTARAGATGHAPSGESAARQTRPASATQADGSRPSRCRRPSRS
jgi:hypothetical protein